MNRGKPQKADGSVSEISNLRVALPLLFLTAMTRLSLLAILALAACDGGDGGVGPDAGADAAPELGQGSLARGPLVVNELSAKPGPGAADWLEILNRTDEAIDLCDYFVTGSLDRLDHYHHLAAAPPPALCEPTLLGAGEYKVIFADDDVSAGPDHAPFKLGEADEAHIVSVRGEAVDSLIFLFPSDASGLSLARMPDGEGLFWVGQPSSGSENEGEAP